MQQPLRIELAFYRSASGREPVRDWLLSLESEHRRAIGRDLERVQYRWPVGMPLVRPLGSGLFEVRTTLSNGVIARVLFGFHGDWLLAVHGLIKKTQKLAPADLALARARMKEIESG